MAYFVKEMGPVGVLFWAVVGFYKIVFYILRFLFRGLVSGRAKGLDFPLQARFEHTHIVGGSGWGKTQLLQNLFAHLDLEALMDGKRSVIIMDSQGDMLKTILSLNHLTPGTLLADRLIYIDPNDIEHPPCLNLFDFGLDRLKHYDPVEREKILNGAISIYEYMFGALLGAELTNRQGVIFRYLARLLMEVPHPTIYTLMDFMEEPELVRPHLKKLDLGAQRFFTSQFLSPNFDNTRQQILTRLWGVLSNPVLARMFSHTENKLNMFEAMNRGSLILINTAKDLLKQEGCEIFGRFMISLIGQATQERAAIPEDKRLPTFVYIDEAQDYFDDNLEQFLNTSRKYRVGLILAHQNLTQFDRKLRETVMASTAIKFAGGVSVNDAEALAKEMHGEAELLQALKKEKGQTQFALYIRNLTPEAACFVVELGLLEKLEKMTREQQQALLAKNRERYCAPVDQKLLSTSPAVTQSGIMFDLEEPKAL